MLLNVFHDLLLRIPSLLRRCFPRTEQRIHPVQRPPHAVIRLCAADSVKLSSIACGLRVELMDDARIRLRQHQHQTPHVLLRHASALVFSAYLAQDRLRHRLLARFRTVDELKLPLDGIIDPPVGRCKARAVGQTCRKLLRRCIIRFTNAQNALLQAAAGDKRHRFRVLLIRERDPLRQRLRAHLIRPSRCDNGRQTRPGKFRDLIQKVKG